MAGLDLPEDRGRIDYRLLSRSPIRVFHESADLEAAVEWLRGHEYAVVDVDASWMTSRRMFADLASAFPACCRDNFQCRHEGLGEGLLDALGTAAGLALVLRGFDTYAGCCWTDARQLLDLLAQHAWRIAMGGGRFITLVQADEPLGPVAGTSWAVTPWDLDRP